MRMTMKEYAKSRFNLPRMLAKLKSDPVKLVEEADFLPFDEVMSVEGELVKVVFTSDGTSIRVLDLISMTPEEAAKLGKDVEELYKVYMENIDLEDVSIDSIINIAKAHKRRKEELKTCIR